MSDRSAGTTTARRPSPSTCAATSSSCRLGASRDHDVGPRFGEGEGGSGADAPPGGGDDGDAVVETEAVDQHAGTLPGRYVARMTASRRRRPAHARFSSTRSTTALSNWGRWGTDDELGAAQLPHARAARRGGRAGAHRCDREPGPRLPGHPVARDAEPRAPPHAGQRRRPRLERHPGLRGEPRLHRHRGARDGHHPPRRAVPHVRAGRDVQRPTRRRREEHRRADATR